MSELVKGLLITGIGMGLVFVVIIMLWGVMAGLGQAHLRHTQKEEALLKRCQLRLKRSQGWAVVADGQH